MSNNDINVLLASVNYPNKYHVWAPWNKTSNMAISKNENIKSEILVPLPFAPPFKFLPYNEFSEIPLIENSEEGAVHHPRFLYLLPKTIFYGFIGDLYKKSVSKYVMSNMVKPDLIHAHQVYPDGYGLMELCKRWSIPLVVDIHGIDSIKTWLNHEKIRNKVIKTLEYSSKVICISDSIGDILKELGMEDKIEYVSLGVDLNNFRPGNNDKIRKNLGIEEKRVLLVVGQLIKRKGIDYFLMALPKIIKSYEENFKVLIVGAGVEKENLLELTKKLNLNDTVEFLGEVTGKNLFDLYSMADIFVLSSLAEGRPMVIYEAMASECAVIATNVDGIPEQIKDEYNGLLVEPKNVDQLSEKILYLLENEDIMEKMGINGRKKIIEEKWTWEDYAEKIVKIYNDVLD
jgi:glycosyltransferase involved in cell wall biosynthesis